MNNSSAPNFLSFVEVKRNIGKRDEINGAVGSLARSIESILPDDVKRRPHFALSPAYFVNGINDDDGYGDGTYSCKYYADVKQAIYDPSQSLTVANLLNTSTPDGDAIFVNLFETGRTGHALTDTGGDSSSIIGMGEIWRHTADGKPVIFGYALRFDPCTTP